MQGSGAMRVHRSFRVAGGARRVAQADGRALVEFGPSVVGRSFGEQALVVDELRELLRGRLAILVDHRDPAAHVRAMLGDRLDDRQEGRVESEVRVAGVVDDPRDLLRMQPRIDRVDHRAHAADAVVQLHVPVTVPGERGDAVADADARARQRVGKSAGSVLAVGIRVAMDVALYPARDDLGVPMVSGRMLQNARHEQRHVHHQSLHGALRRDRHAGVRVR
jgi:hypothetical protein